MDDNIVGFEPLYKSHLKSQHGVIWKGSVARYSLHGLEETLKLSNQLTCGTYMPRPPISFTITKPKRREIIATAYRDRVYQRSLNDNAIYPKMTASFVKENGACQIGRGADYGRDVLKRYLRRWYINNGRSGWILQIDIKSYYQSMKHDTVMRMFCQRLNSDESEQVDRIITWQYGGDTGFNPGSQMIQIAGISLLNGIDHFIKEKLHVKDYVRYMDDMILICYSRRQAEYFLRRIQSELAGIGLRTHERKTKIFRIDSKITFLGFDWTVTETGKIVMAPKSQTIKAFRHSLNQLLKLYAKGKRTLGCADVSFQVRMSYLKKGNTYHLRQRLNKWYADRRKYYVIQKIHNDPGRTCAAGQCSSAGREEPRRC